MGSWPEDVGIISVEMVFPSQYVDQTDLELYDGASAGKYVIGLGQSKMGFCNDREDINSLCLTVVHKLMERNSISYSDVGFLQVGTETIIDKSKSIKTVLMQLFEKHGCTDVEGIDTTNACYGGTAALFNAIAWVESSLWDGRYAIAVAGDIAVYAKGSARPTGGAGAVAMLIGPCAPLVIDRGVRATYSRHTYDFYKPDLTSEYPVVDGKLSIETYLVALDNCYQLYCKRLTKQNNSKVDLRSLDYMLFHTPFCKLVEKSVARISLIDYLNSDSSNNIYEGLEKFKSTKLSESYFDKDVEKAFMKFSRDLYEKKTLPSLLLANQIGNMYTASLYGGLVSLLINQSIEQLAGSKIGLFSYGSGLAATMYSITVSKDCNDNSALADLISGLSNVKKQLEMRKRVQPEKFNAILDLRQSNCHKASYEPLSDIHDLFPDTYYLTKVDDKYRRFYKQFSHTSNGTV